MYRVEITANPDATFLVKSKDYEFIIGIKDKGISPPDTLLAGLASCIGVYIRKYCEGSGVKLDNFSVTAEADLSQDKPVCFRKIDVFLDLKGARLDERRERALLEFIKNCPVHNTLHMNPEVDTKII